jgi:hypothetical protein
MAITERSIKTLPASPEHPDREYDQEYTQPHGARFRLLL